jgi:hypothetical protein
LKGTVDKKNFSVVLNEEYITFTEEGKVKNVVLKLDELDKWIKNEKTMKEKIKK